MNTTKRYPPEFRQRAVRPVETAQPGGKPEWAAIRSVCEKLGRTRETLPRWIRQDHSDRGVQHVSIRDSERLSEVGVTPSVGSVGDSYDCEDLPAEKETMYDQLSAQMTLFLASDELALPGDVVYRHRK